MIIANSVVAQKKLANPDMDKDAIKKKGHQALAAARARFGGKTLVNITDKEWEAIQAGAITTNVLKKIMDHTDTDILKELATPRSRLSMSPAQISKAKLLLSQGYTQSEVATSLGVSVSTILKAI
jgi:Trp operon repressor